MYIYLKYGRYSRFFFGPLEYIIIGDSNLRNDRVDFSQLLDFHVLKLGPSIIMYTTHMRVSIQKGAE